MKDKNLIFFFFLVMLSLRYMQNIHKAMSSRLVDTCIYRWKRTLSWEYTHSYGSQRILCFSLLAFHETGLTRFHSVTLASNLLYKFLFHSFSNINMTHYSILNWGDCPTSMFSFQKLKCTYHSKTII